MSQGSIWLGLGTRLGRGLCPSNRSQRGSIPGAAERCYEHVALRLVRLTGGFAICETGKREPKDRR